MRGLKFLNTYRGSRDAWLIAKQARVLTLLTTLEIRVLGARLFDRLTEHQIAYDEGIRVDDVEQICAAAIRTIEDAGFVVQRPPSPDDPFVIYVPNEELDRRPAA